MEAKIICDSVSPQGVRITTFELTYPRIVHAEMLTHRMFSRNAASSRAIPFNKMKEQLTGRPVRFGEANPGMQDKGVDFDKYIKILEPDGWDDGFAYNYYLGKEVWEKAKLSALEFSQAFYDAGFHKQVYNRLTEPFQMIKVLVTATEFTNFFWLRNDNAADPTLHELARLMQEEYDRSEPKLLQPGQWHLPYVEFMKGGTRHGADIGQEIVYFESNESDTVLTIEDAIKVSAARCAAVSFRNTDYTLEKSLEVYERLVGDERKHASAFEHQATPMYSKMPSTYGINEPAYGETWQEGITHVDKNGQLWSGNFRGFIQYRQFIPGHNKT